MKSKTVKCEPKKVAEFDYSGLDPSFSKLAKPAQRALLNNGIRTPSDLAKKTLDEILEFHGIGPSAVPIMTKVLKARGMRFKTTK